MPRINENRWVTSDDIFAARLEFPEIKGSFKPNGFIQRLFKLFGTEVLVVEPGTHAWFVANGHAVGNLEPGQHTMQSCLEKFDIWKIKQATVILCRSEDLLLNFFLVDIPTRDGVVLDLNIGLTIQMEQHGLGVFTDSFLGASAEVTTTEIKNRFQPLIEQSVKQAIAQIPTDELMANQTAETISATVAEQLDVRMKRYGFRFIQTEVADIYSESLTDRAKKKGDLWGREQDIQDNVRRLKIKSALRKQHLSDAFDKVETKEQYAEFIDNVDQNKLLRQAEKNKLLFEFDNNKEDRETLRNHMVAVLEMERDFELDNLNADYEHTLNLRSINQELEVAKLGQSAKSDELISYLEQRKTKIESKREEQQVDWQHWRDKQTVKRDDEWDNILHERRLLDVQSDSAIAKAENESQIAIIDLELKKRIEDQEFDEEKRRKQWELDVTQQESENQLDRLAKVQQMNADFASQQTALEEDQADRQSQRDLDKLAALNDVSKDVLIATSDTANAQLLSGANSQEEILQAKLEAEREKNEAVTDVYKQMAQGQKEVVGALTGTGIPGAASPTAPPPPNSPVSNSKWYLARDAQTHGPYTQTELSSFISTGNVVGSDQVCQEGSTAWVSINSVTDFQQLFGTAPPPPPPPPA